MTLARTRSVQFRNRLGRFAHFRKKIKKKKKSAEYNINIMVRCVCYLHRSLPFAYDRINDTSRHFVAGPSRLVFPDGLSKTGGGKKEKMFYKKKKKTAMHVGRHNIIVQRPLGEDIRTRIVAV